MEISDIDYDLEKLVKLTIKLKNKNGEKISFNDFLQHYFGILDTLGRVSEPDEFTLCRQINSGRENLDPFSMFSGMILAALMEKSGYTLDVVRTVMTEDDLIELTTRAIRMLDSRRDGFLNEISELRKDLDIQIELMRTGLLEVINESNGSGREDSSGGLQLSHDVTEGEDS